jgi:hypothetical protein
MKDRAVKLFKENEGKFKTKRQASKYLNGYGMVYKAERGIELSAPKRGKQGDKGGTR